MGPTIFAYIIGIALAASENQKSESERYLFNPHKKFIQSNNEKSI